jgi:hypothetical protein
MWQLQLKIEEQSKKLAVVKQFLIKTFQNGKPQQIFSLRKKEWGWLRVKANPE